MTDYGEISGTKIFAYGIVSLILVSVIASSFVNQRIQESKSYREIERNLVRGYEEIQDLEQYAENLQLSLVLSETTLKRRLQQLNFTQSEVDRAKQIQIILVRRRSSLQDQLKLLKNEFSTYCEQYRQSAWSRAVGESLGDFTTAEGRTLHQATISKVTSDGLEIRHQDGFERVAASSLSASLRSRFQWASLPASEK
jgi:hypothetical protein